MTCEDRLLLPAQSAKAALELIHVPASVFLEQLFGRIQSITLRALKVPLVDILTHAMIDEHRFVHEKDSTVGTSDHFFVRVTLQVTFQRADRGRHVLAVVPSTVKSPVFLLYSLVGNGRFNYFDVVIDVL